MDEKGIGNGDDLPNLAMVNNKGRGRISNRIDGANSGNTIQFKSEVNEDYLEEKAVEKEETVEKKGKKRVSNSPSKIRWVAGIFALIALTTIIVEAKQKGRDVEKEPTTDYTEKYTKNEESSNIILEKEIITVKDVERDFTEKYLEAYNKRYGTNYTSAEIIVNSLEEGAVYVTNSGKYVTKGSNSESTAKVLNDLGENYTLKSDIVDKVVQIMVDGEPIATYNTENGQVIFSGNSNNLKERLQKDKEPTLKELGINPDKLAAAASVVESLKYESKDSQRIRIKNYNSKSFENSKDKGFEIDD